MSAIYDGLDPHNKLDGLWAGKIATNPATVDDLVEVILPSFSDQHRIGPCPWTRVNGTTLPVRGNRCLVGFDENERPYVIAWWTGV